MMKNKKFPRQNDKGIYAASTASTLAPGFTRGIKEITQLPAVINLTTRVMTLSLSKLYYKG